MFVFISYCNYYFYYCFHVKCFSFFSCIKRGSIISCFFFKELINFVIFQILGYLTSVAMVKKSSLTNHCYMPRRLLKKKKKDIGTKEGIKKRKTREDSFSLKIVSCSSFCFSLYSRNFEKKYKIENFDSTTAKKKKKMISN